MCKDCGCSITDHHGEHHHHDHGEHHHHHHHDKDHHHHHDTIGQNPQLNDAKTISIITKILDKNDNEAKHNRAHFDKHNVLAINLMSSPGSGKTSMLEALVDTGLKFAVIEGDLETNKDADRLKAKGVEAYQIQTGSACHLDAFMVHKALHHIDLHHIDICFVENVGNLVCPASYDVGCHLNIVLLSVPEGADKVAKYPVMFRSADLVVVTKCDLLPYFDFSIDEVKEEAKRLKPSVDIITLSTKDDTIAKIKEWIEYKIKFRG